MDTLQAVVELLVVAVLVALATRRFRDVKQHPELERELRGYILRALLLARRAALDEALRDGIIGEAAFVQLRRDIDGGLDALQRSDGEPSTSEGERS